MFEFIQSLAIDLERNTASSTAHVPTDWPPIYDHFPANPLLPGSILVELAAQVAGILSEELSRNATGKVTWSFLGAIRNMTFLQPVMLPATIQIEARCHAILNTAMTVRLKEFVDDSLVCRAELIVVSRESGDGWAEAIAARDKRLGRWLNRTS